MLRCSMDECQTRAPRMFSSIGRLVSTATLITLMAAMAGCNENGTSSAHALDQAVRDYDAERYQLAYDSATHTYRNAKTNEKADAAYLAGLSAYRLGHMETARQYLGSVVRHPNSKISGPASATLGLLELEHGSATRAAEHFARAERLTTGQDQAEAAYQCGLAHKKLGQTSLARTHFLIARGATRETAFRTRIDRELQFTGFTIQIGAFESLENARVRAREHNASPLSRTIGSARVVQSHTTPTGLPLYLVQIGTFQSHDTATAALGQVGRTAMVTSLGAGLDM